MVIDYWTTKQGEMADEPFGSIDGNTPKPGLPRRGKRAEAEEHVKAARAALDSMTELSKAVSDLEKANRADPFIQCLLGHAYEKSGDKEKTAENYRKASLSTAHNPPAAFAKPFAQKRLSMLK